MLRRVHAPKASYPLSILGVPPIVGWLKMSEDKVNGQRGAGMDFFHIWLEAARLRSFERQIRSEECGCCLGAWSQDFYECLTQQQENGCLYLSELLRKIGAFVHLPRYTLWILESAAVLMRTAGQKLANGLSADPYHRSLADAVEELTDTAMRAFDAPQYLLFCRISQPLTQIGQTYAELCNRAGIPEDNNRRVTECFDMVRRRIRKLQQDQKKDVDGWVNEGRKRLTHVRLPATTKAIWSSGECTFYDTDGKLRTLPTAKVLRFTHKTMTVYSREPLENNCTYTCQVQFNCIDLPFVTRVMVESELTKLTAHEREISATCGAPHRYVLKFTGSLDHPQPEPHYYFLSMCRDLFELHIPWGTHAFTEVMCSNHWAKASLPREIPRA